jgi:hypothetical protein
MSGDDQTGTSPNSRTRRGSITSAAFTNLFQRSNSTTAGTSAFPGPITSAAMNDQTRRRLSVTTMGLSGTSPTAAGLRRASLSTSSNSDSIDESAVEDGDSSAPATQTSFARRMSFGAQAMRTLQRGGASPNSSNGRQRRQSSALPTAREDDDGGNGSSPWSSMFPQQASTSQHPRTNSDSRADQGFNWSEQLRSRAESAAASTAARPSFSFGSGGLNGSPPRGSVSAAAGGTQHHDRAKSVSDMPAPPAQAPKVRQDTRPKPDHFQERILKGDFYMD